MTDDCLDHYSSVGSREPPSTSNVDTSMANPTLGSIVPDKPPEALRRGFLRLTGALLPVLTLAAPASAQVAGDSAAVAAVVERYHRSLQSSDSASALALLAPDAVIIESGGVESRQEYRSHHLPADIAFARAVKESRSPVRVTLRGDAAWAVATATTRGTYRGRAVHSTGAELMVLTRTPDGWTIRAIHWSSRDQSQR